jgi:hypothetical protein
LALLLQSSLGSFCACFVAISSPLLLEFMLCG